MAVAITASPSTSPHSANPLFEGEDDAPALIAGGDEGEQGGRHHPVVGPDSELIND